MYDVCMIYDACIGLISGIATFLKHIKPSIHIIGCQPRHNSCMNSSIEANRLLTEPNTFPNDPSTSDATDGERESERAFQH